MSNDKSHDGADNDPQNCFNHDLNAQRQSGNGQLPPDSVEEATQPESANESVVQPHDIKDSSARIEQKVNSLVELVRSNERNHWAVADLVAELTEKHGVRLAVLQERTGWKAARLSSLKKTALAFPPEVRDQSRPVWDYEKTRECFDRICTEAKAHLQQVPSLSEALKEFTQPDYIAKLNEVTEAESQPVTVNTKKGKSKVVTRKYDKRATTNFFGKKLRMAISAATAKPSPVQQHPVLDRCYHLTNEALLEQWAKDGLQVKFRLIGMDAPYGDYDKYSDGHLDQDTSAAPFTDADHIDAEAARRTTCNTIRKAAAFLDVGGVILLWQGCRYLHPDIGIAIDESGLGVELCLVWVKPVPQPGHFVTAWTRQCEFCYVICRKGEKPLNHQDSSRSNVLSGPEFWFDGPATQAEAAHWWRKPSSLMEFLVAKSTYENDNVLDLFACTGSLSKAAAKLNRRFIYCESNAESFEEYSPRVLRALEEAQKSRSAMHKSAAKVHTNNGVRAAQEEIGPDVPDDARSDDSSGPVAA